MWDIIVWGLAYFQREAEEHMQPKRDCMFLEPKPKKAWKWVKYWQYWKIISVKYLTQGKFRPDWSTHVVEVGSQKTSDFIWPVTQTPPPQPLYTEGRLARLWLPVLPCHNLIVSSHPFFSLEALLPRVSIVHFYYGPPTDLLGDVNLWHNYEVTGNLKSEQIQNNDTK